MKFIADSMLGKLARWLRMLGYDVKYSNKFNDAQLIMIAKKEGRILLTKDLELHLQATKKGVCTLYLEGRTEIEKLVELAERFNIRLDIDMARTRCPKCNTTVKHTLKREVIHNVEEKTFAYNNEFWRCPKCEQIYWQGTHWKRIERTLETTKKLRPPFKAKTTSNGPTKLPPMES